MNINTIIILIFSILSIQLLINAVYVFVVFKCCKTMANISNTSTCKNHTCTKIKLEE